MLRVVLSPRWIGLTLLLVLAIAVCARLGLWQWDRAHPEATVDPSREAATALRDVLDRPEGLDDVPPGVLVRASGRYDTAPDATTTVARELDGERGRWVLTPLRLDGDREVLVLRGWVPRSTGAADLPAPVATDVVVTGRLQPPGSEPGVDEAFVALTDQQPPGDDPLQQVAFPAAPPDTALNLVNAFYALQWFIFAAFWVYLWGRALRDDVEAARASTAVHASDTA